MRRPSQHHTPFTIGGRAHDLAAGHKGYLCPFLDHPIVPADAPWDFAIDWNDDEIFGEILRMMNERQSSGDIPMNLLCTSLMTHAYLCK